jgi:hypothetical protein
VLSQSAAEVYGERTVAINTSEPQTGVSFRHRSI